RFFQLRVFLVFRLHKLNLITEFIGYNSNRLRIQPLVDGYKQPKTHTGSNNLCYLYPHHAGQIIGSYKLSNFQHFGHHFLLHCRFFCRLSNIIPLLAAQLRSLSKLTRLTGTAKTGQCRFNLILDFLFRRFFAGFPMPWLPSEIRPSFASTLWVGGTVGTRTLCRFIFTLTLTLLIVGATAR